MGRGQGFSHKSDSAAELPVQPLNQSRETSNHDSQVISRTESIKENIKSTLKGSSSIKLWLDDDLEDRQAPSGWLHVQTASEAIQVLKTGRVVEMSLDHDLGDDDLYGRGVDVVDFLCERSFNNDPLWPEEISLHTANPYGRDSMLRSLTRFNQDYKVSFLNSQPILKKMPKK